MSGNIFVGVDLASDKSHSALVQQYIAPDGTIRFLNILPYQRKVVMAKQQDWIKLNKYAIVTIMCKEIARELRERHPDLYVEAHPRPGPNQARILVRQLMTDSSFIIDLNPGGVTGQWFAPAGQVRNNDFTAFPQFSRKNKVARKKNPEAFSFALDDPNGTTSLEEWIEGHVVEWFYADTSKQQTESASDSDGSTESGCDGISESENPDA